MTDAIESDLTPDPACSAGRGLTRPSPHDGLDWETPCPAEVVVEMPFEPPLMFCEPHYRQVADVLYAKFVGLGYVLR